MIPLTFFLVVELMTVIGALTFVRFAYRAGYAEGRLDSVQEMLERRRAMIEEHIKTTRGWN